MRKTLKKNIRSQYLLQIAKYIVPFVTLPYLTRVLGADAYSVRVYVLSIMTILQSVIDFGFTNYGTLLIAKARLMQGNPSKYFSCIINSKVIIIVLSSVVLVLLILLIPTLSENELFVFFSFLGIVVNALLPDFVFQGFEKMSAITKRYVLAKIISTLLIFILVHNPSDLLLIPLCDMAGNLVGVVWALWHISKEFEIKYQRKCWKGLIIHLKKSFQYFSISFCSTMLNSLSIAVVGILNVSSVGLSVWSLSLTLINAAQSMYTPIINSLYPDSLMHKDYSIVRSLSLKALPFVLLVITLLIILSPMVVEILAGPEYMAGSYLLSATSPLILFSFYKALYGWPVLGASGHVKELGFATYLAAFITVILLVFGVLLQFCNLEYVIAVRIISEASSCIFVLGCYFYFRRSLNID